MVTKKKLPTVGKKVRFKRRNGDIAEGKITGQAANGNGVWVDVKHADGTSTRVRPSQCEVL